MSLTASCPTCRRQLNVRDELLGKRLKCPGCGNTFTADATTTRSKAASGTAVGAIPISKRAPAGPRSAERAPRVHVSRGVILLAVVAIALPTIFFIWRVGPGKAMAEWRRIEPDAEQDVKDIVTRAIQAYHSARGDFDPSKSHQAPHAHEVKFLISPMPWRLPESVGFGGNSTDGAFSGNYHPRTGEIDAIVDIGGFALAGAGVGRRGDVTINVTGRIKNGVVSVEIDGKTAELVYPKRADE